MRRLNSRMLRLLVWAQQYGPMMTPNAIGSSKTSKPEVSLSTAWSRLIRVCHSEVLSIRVTAGSLGSLAFVSL